MLHRQIWGAIDQLAAARGLTTSGLARAAGLDPTTFNPSKRQGPDGRPRWPSTESLARALAAVESSLEDFSALVSGKPPHAGRAIPILGLARAGQAGAFDPDGYPAAASETVRFPGLSDERVYALEISGDSMEPVYRDGDVVIVQPGASIRRHDRVIVRTRAGALLAKQIGRRSEETLELISLNPAFEPTILANGDVEWIARIVWASQ